MQRQAVPLMRSEAPLVGTGMEYRAEIDAGKVASRRSAGTISEVSADLIEIAADDGTYETIRLTKSVARTRHLHQPAPAGHQGQRVEKGRTRERPCTEKGEMALGATCHGAFHAVERFTTTGRRIILGQTSWLQDDVLSLDPRRGAPGRHPRRQARHGGVAETSPTSNRDARQPGRARHRPDRRGGHHGESSSAGLHQGETGDPEERLSGDLSREGPPRRATPRSRSPHGGSGTVIGVRVFDRERTTNSARRQPTGTGLRRPEAEIQKVTSWPALTATRV